MLGTDQVLNCAGAKATKAVPPNLSAFCRLTPAVLFRGATLPSLSPPRLDPAEQESDSRDFLVEDPNSCDGDLAPHRNTKLLFWFD